jgi:hypothetical protein
MFSLNNMAEIRASVMVVALLLFGFAPASCAQQTAKITGTYTNMHFNREGGDLLGQELKIVRTRKGYQGALQFAEGGAGELIIVEVNLEGDRISFVIPDSYADAGQFNGTIQNGVIRGLFKFKGGGEERVELKKGKSYWD